MLNEIDEIDVLFATLVALFNEIGHALSKMIEAIIERVTIVAMYHASILSFFACSFGSWMRDISLL